MRYLLDANARTCILRIRAGEDAIDPDYLVDYKQLTGSYVTRIVDDVSYFQLGETATSRGVIPTSWSSSPTA